MQGWAALDAALLAAHAAGDGARLARLYVQAAQAARELGEAERGWFYLTQGWIFALEAGDPLAESIAAELRAGGRL
ncbi:MAG: hypothetical protein D6811_09740 [Alphaproteobacteria bacterium]|nr:MAG: hypothetical protein D6811_09740 [Alphaproteobacteria bacterium]